MLEITRAQIYHSLDKSIAYFKYINILENDGKIDAVREIIIDYFYLSNDWIDFAMLW